MRVWSPPTLGCHFVRDDRKESRADADQHHGAKAGGFVAQFPLESHGATQQRGEQEPANNYSAQVLEHRILPAAAGFHDGRFYNADGRAFAAAAYNVNEVSFEKCRARALISLSFKVVRRSTPKRSHVKLPITEPYTIARRSDFSFTRPSRAS